MTKWENFLFEIEYRFGEMWKSLKQQFPTKKRILLKNIIDSIALYLIVLFLIIISSRLGNIGNTTIHYNEPTQLTTSGGIEISQSVELGKAIKEVIRVECEKQGVPESLVYAIINSTAPTEDALPRYGVMKLHPDLINKYNANYPDGMGIVMSIYSNVVSGVERLAWCLESNQSLEGALMSYIYTQPEAKKMWDLGIGSTEWTDAVKEGM